MNQAAIYNSASLNRVYGALVPQSATSGTAITTGIVVDRNALGYPMSSNLVITGSYTVASGATGDTIVVAGTVQQGSSLSGGNIVSPTTLTTFSFTVPWVSSASARTFVLSEPLNFNGAQEYIRLSSLTLTATSAGGTYSALTVGAAHVLGGMAVLPDPLWTDAGYVGYAT